MAIKISDSAAGTKRYRGAVDQPEPNRFFGQETLDNRGRQFNKAPDVSGDMMRATQADYSATKDVINVATDLAKQGVEYYVAIKESEDKERTNSAVLLANEQERDLEKAVKDEQIKGGKSVGWYEDQMTQRTANMWQELESNADLRSSWGKSYFKDQKHREQGQSQNRRLDNANKMRTKNAIEDTGRRLDITMHEARETNDLVNLKVTEEKIEAIYLERAMYDVTMTPEQLAENTRLAKIRMYDNFYDEQGQSSAQAAAEALESFEINVAPIGYEPLPGDSPDMVNDVYTREEYEDRVKDLQKKLAAHTNDEARASATSKKTLKETRDSNYNQLRIRETMGESIPTDTEILDLIRLPKDDPRGISESHGVTLLKENEKVRKTELEHTAKIEEFADGRYKFNQSNDDDVAAVQWNFETFSGPAIEQKAQETYPGQPGKQMQYKLEQHADYYANYGVLPAKEIENIERGLSDAAGDAQNVATVKYARTLMDKNVKFVDILPDDVRARVNYVNAGGVLAEADEKFDTIENIEPKRRRALTDKVDKQLDEFGDVEADALLDEFFETDNFRNDQDRTKFGIGYDTNFQVEYLTSDGSSKFAKAQTADTLRSQWGTTSSYGRPVNMQHPPEKVLGYDEPQRWIQEQVHAKVTGWVDAGVDIDPETFQLVATYDDTLNPVDGVVKYRVADQYGQPYQNQRTGEYLYYKPLAEGIYKEMEEAQNGPNPIAQWFRDTFGGEEPTLQEQNAELARRREQDLNVAP